MRGPRLSSDNGSRNGARNVRGAVGSFHPSSPPMAFYPRKRENAISGLSYGSSPILCLICRHRFLWSTDAGSIRAVHRWC